MKKVLIICAAGMSSSMIAKKATLLLQSRGSLIEVDAVPVTEGEQMIAKGDFDLFLVSPQTTMHLENYQTLAADVGKLAVPIPFQAYVPIPMGIEKIADLILANL